MASALGEARLLDVTLSPAAAQVFSREDLVVFGAPVYGGRVFAGALERLSPLRGQGTPCIVTVTYGNRDFDDALLELTDFCRERGFVPLAGAALVGEHTYGSIQVGRPTAEDLEQDRAFALEAWDDWNAGWEGFSPPGNRPYREGARAAALCPLPWKIAPAAACAGTSAPWGPLGRTVLPLTAAGASPASGASNAARSKPRAALPQSTRALPRPSPSA